MRNTLGFLFVSAMVAGVGAMAGCGGTTNAGPDGGTTPDLASAAATCPNGSICAGGTIADQTLNLADTASVSFTVKANADFKGMVTINPDLASLSALSGGTSAQIVISAVPLTFDGTNQSQTVLVHVSTSTDAAAFSAKPIVLHMTDPANAANKFDLTFNLTVNPSLTLTIGGDATNGWMWSTDTALGVTNKQTIPIRRRPLTGTGANTVGGTTFIFENKTNAAWALHGTDGTPVNFYHQGQSNGAGGYNVAPNPTSNVATSAVNGTYVLNNVNDMSGTPVGGFYSHAPSIAQTAALNNVPRNFQFNP